MTQCSKMVLAWGVLIGGLAGTVLADEAAVFFDDTVVQEVHITFDDANWYNALFDAHANDPSDPYFPARFEWNDVVMDPVGVRFKGNSSFGIPGPKKGLKIDFDEFDEDNDDLDFLGLKKLNFSNGFKDPSFLREKLFIDIASKYVPTLRAVHTKVYVNDEYLGLYIAIEQVDKDFVQDRIDNDEDGNLWKGAASDDNGNPGGDFGSDLTWMGSEAEPYYERYQLKTNETENDYSQLIEFINVLNNVPASSLPDQLDPIADVDNLLMCLALNSMFANLDSYTGSAHNYYVYDRDTDGRFIHIHWDLNEAFGRFRFAMPPQADLQELDPFWAPTGQEFRPLMENLWAVDEWSKTYLRFHAQIMREGFDTATMEARINELADTIRSAVYADSNKPYPNSAFEQNLYNDWGSGPDRAYGLQSFITNRSAYLEDELNTDAEPGDIQLNELMASNTQTVTDGQGEYEPWIEIYNLGPGLVDLGDLALTDELTDPDKWSFSGTLDDGGFAVIWLDGETGEGSDHASFTIDPDEGTLYLMAQSGGSWSQVDLVTWNSLGDDVSWGRSDELDSDWQRNGEPSPGAENIPSPLLQPGQLYVNEFMADNETSYEDPDQSGEYDDWIELYNPGAEELHLGGVHLTDDLDNPTAWIIPDGVSIEAGGFLVIMADENENQGDLHASFRLSSSGESIAIIGGDGTTVIDSIDYEQQQTDVSYGRVEDAGEPWSFLESATPGSSNEVADPCPSDLDGDGEVNVNDILLVIAGWDLPDGDVDGDGTTNVNDILIVIAAWGDCG